MTATDPDIYYDPFDFEIDTDPYPVWGRLRRDRPVYYNERYDFYALSRFGDVERGLRDWRTYSSAKGTLLELIKSNMEILTDTQGVDFGPYLARVVESVRMNWYNLIPEAARSPLFKKGIVAIDFYILKDGRVAGMQLEGPSGDVSLDRAAWGGITACNPFKPLPDKFTGQYLALRMRFYYNPDKSDMKAGDN